MGDWTVVVPAKPLATAKSRLAPPGGVDRQLLVLAMLLDTVTAADSCPQVARLVVVTCDPILGSEAQRYGAEIIQEPWPTGLNQSLAQVMPRLSTTRRVAVVTSDLPALRPQDLDAVLRTAHDSPRGLVPDAAGTGTTMLTARTPDRLQPAFGAGSALRHRRAGAEIISAPASARRDVDTWPDLLAAARLGIRGHTATALGPASARAANQYPHSSQHTHPQESPHVPLAG